MARAGLTHGGFYAHFKSKDDLVAHAITRMFDEAYATFLSLTEGRDPAKGLSNYIDMYMAPKHRDDPAHGCPIAALSADARHLGDFARSRFGEGTERMVAAIAKQLKKMGEKGSDALASSILSEMAGAVALARAVVDAERSLQILRSSRAAVTARLDLAK
jgi:TetR/AcrR family transcriptional repressor of nem operon